MASSARGELSRCRKNGKSSRGEDEGRASKRARRTQNSELNRFKDARWVRSWEEGSKAVEDWKDSGVEGSLENGTASLQAMMKEINPANWSRRNTKNCVERIQKDTCLIHVKESAIFPADFTCDSEFQTFQELKAGRRENLSQYQKQIAKEHIEKELEKWQDGQER
nr:pinin [Ipomoea batatas]